MHLCFNRKNVQRRSLALDRSATWYDCLRYNSLTMLNEDSIAELKTNSRGRLIKPGDPDYDNARKGYNGMIHKKPRWRAQCVDVADHTRPVNSARRKTRL